LITREVKVKKPLIAAAVVIVIALLAFLNFKFKKEKLIAVEVEEVARRKVEKIVSASGRIKPKRRVNVSASAIGKVTKIAVKEGDRVEKGDFLLEIDPTEYRTMVDKLESGIRAAQASLAVEQASLKKAEYDYQRAEELYAKGFLSENELKDAAINLKIQRSKVKSAKENLFQQQSALDKARHDLKQVRITAEMSGVVTALNVEEGENAIMGTLNNPGTVLLTIADLSAMEAEVEVDETDVIYVKKGQKAKVELDAYPDTSFSGVVTEVGNSAIPSRGGLEEKSVDFKVVISILDSIPGIRPGLSASTEIKVASIDSALAIPIQCLTVRKKSELEGASSSSKKKEGTADKEIEGVFVIEDGTARFRPVTVGLAGKDYFEVEKGLKAGEKVVSGPFKVLKTLADGDKVKIKKGLSGRAEK
jgi:HlyD family secretion protein